MPSGTAEEATAIRNADAHLGTPNGPAATAARFETIPEKARFAYAPRGFGKRLGVIALAGVGVGVLFASTGNAAKKGNSRSPARSAYASSSARAPDPPPLSAPSGDRGGCYVTYSPTDATRGIRHWRPGCR